MNKDVSPLPKNTRQKRNFTVTVSVSAVISSLLLLSAGFVAVFALGVLLGRGYNLEASIPELERIMPQPSPTSAPFVIANDKNASSGLPADADKEASAASGILEQGDLAYPDTLKTPSPAARQQPQKPVAAKPAVQEKKEPPATPKTTDNARTAEQAKPKPVPPGTPSVGTAPVRTAAKPQTTDKTADQTANTRTYHYVYQAAAYKDKPSCDKFAARLTSAGFRARTEHSVDNGTTWYRTVIDFTGKPDDTDQLRERLKKHGVERVIMKTKVPAN